MSTYLSTSDVAKGLNLSVQQVRNLCRGGKLPAEKVGGAWVLRAGDVQTHIDAVQQKNAEDHARLGVIDSKRPILLSFFSGAMGLDLGLEAAGFETLLACESDKWCRETIKINRPNMALVGDILNQTPDSIRDAAGISRNSDIDLVAGGPPCQAFSTAGKRRGFSDDRGNVFLTYITLALALRPKFIVIENVRGLMSCPLAHRPHSERGDGFPDLAADELPGGALYFILNRLRAAKYSVSFNLYNSANFGTPQKRERVILICSRDGRKMPYLQPTHSEDGIFGLPKWRTFGEAVTGLERTEQSHLNFPDSRVRYYRMLEPGQNWRNLPSNLQQEALGKSYFAGGGKTGFLRRLAWDAPSPTLVTHPAMPATDLAHPIQNRPLSIQEYKRIQEFSDDWKLSGGLVQQYKQIGNAVPASLGKAVGNLLIEYLSGRQIVSYPGFKYSRYKATDDVNWEAEFGGRLAEQTDRYEQRALLL